MEWWDDEWLNEGFGKFMEYKGVAAHETDWDMASMHPPSFSLSPQMT